MNDDRDPILDAMLDEVLSGRSPPDLSARIMQSLAMRGIRPEVSGKASISANGSGAHQASPAVVGMPFVPAPPPVVGIERAIASAAPIITQPVVELRSSASLGNKGRRGKKSSTWQFVAAAAGVITVGIGLGMLGFFTSRNPGKGSPEVVKNPKNRLDNPALVQDGGKKNTNNTTGGKDLVNPDSGTKPGETEIVKNTIPSPAETEQPDPAIPTTPSETSPSATNVAEKRYGQASPDGEIVSFVSAELSRSWTDNGVTPAVLASDSEWCRRVYLRLLGRIPSKEEAKSFIEDSAKDKRPKLVDKLLGDENYIEQYASHWATVWANILIGRTAGNQDGSPVDRAGFEIYLRRSLAQNKPYDQIVRELLTATGSPRPDADGFNGAVNFALAGLNDNATLVTARASRVFLGQQLQCAQCHQHPSQDWSQQDYWALNSFFRQMNVEQENGGVKLVNRDFHALQGQTKEGEVYYQTPSGQMKATGPEFIDGTKISESGLLADVNRRDELAKLVTNSDYLSRALVNRLWAHFFGYGFTRPVDDMGPNNTPSHPEVLDRLAKEFVAHDYDLKKAIRWIVLSDAFSRSSQIPVGSLADSPEAGTSPLFSHYYTRQMQAEEVFSSLLAAAELRKNAGSPEKLAMARVDWLSQFNRTMATDDGAEESQFDGSVRQSLIMMNGDLIQQAAGRGHANLLQTVLKSELPISDKIEHLFLAALSRKPTPKELGAIDKILSTNQADPGAALEDVWWALLNSNEFILDH